MYKVALIQDLLTGAENEQYREALCFKRAFDRVGHHADVFDPRHDTHIWTCLKDYDIVLILQNYDLDFVKKYELISYGGMKIFWSIDSHKMCNAHIEYCSSYNIDYVLVSSKNYVDKFKAHELNAVWIPNCYPADLIYDKKIDRVYNVGFCGSTGNRGSWIESLKKECGLKTDINVIGDSMVHAINSYKIQWNKNEADDVNARTFETLGGSAMLLTNNTPGMSEIFEDGREIVIYDSIEDCIEKIERYSKDDSLRNSIAKRGHRAAFKKHTYDARVQNIINLISIQEQR